MKRKSEKHGLAAELLSFGLLLALVLGIGGCASPRTINVSKQAGLAQAVRLEIAERVKEPQAGYAPRLSVSDPSVLKQINAALDVDLPVGSQVDCLGQYRLGFVLQTGVVQVFDYYCSGGGSFLTGAQAFWSGQTVKPPAEFDATLSNLLRARAVRNTGNVKLTRDYPRANKALCIGEEVRLDPDSRVDA